MSCIIISHFEKNDPIFHKILIKVYEVTGEQIFKLQKSENLFNHLCESIVSQQLSVKAGDMIFNRVLDLLPKRKLTPENILKIKDQDLRKAGLSNNKVKYFKDLAGKIKNDEVNLQKLDQLEDEVVIEELTKIKGIGRWTAEMFLMFALARPDIFSHGDLGLRNAIKKIYGFEEYKVEVVEEIVIKWAPYRTFAARILWRSLEAK